MSAAMYKKFENFIDGIDKNPSFGEFAENIIAKHNLATDYTCVKGSENQNQL